MIVIPAIDLRDGKYVRVRQDDLTTVTAFEGDPVERAKEFVADGAQRLHVSDLDAIFGTGHNSAAIEAICKAVSVPVQVAGGIRSSVAAKRAFDAGASEVILRAVLVEDERVARSMIKEFGERAIAGIDARGSRIATRGLCAPVPVDRDALVKRLAKWGVTRAIFTEIAREGMGLGYDVDAAVHVASLTDVVFTISGGAHTIDDLRALKAAAPANVDSCIVGSALYSGSINLRDAIAAVA
jgi:phosphoribosylformimino-5-aminoimidazole carboxamide ribotide isomerase